MARQLRPGVSVTIQRGPYIGKGGDIVRYHGDGKYVVQLTHLKKGEVVKDQKVIAPRSIFMTYREAVGGLVGNQGRKRGQKTSKERQGEA